MKSFTLLLLVFELANTDDESWLPRESAPYYEEPDEYKRVRADPIFPDPDFDELPEPDFTLPLDYKLLPSHQPSSGRGLEPKQPESNFHQPHPFPEHHPPMHENINVQSGPHQPESLVRQPPLELRPEIGNIDHRPFRLFRGPNRAKALRTPHHLVDPPMNFMPSPNFNLEPDFTERRFPPISPPFNTHTYSHPRHREYYPYAEYHGSKMHPRHKDLHPPVYPHEHRSPFAHPHHKERNRASYGKPQDTTPSQDISVTTSVVSTEVPDTSVAEIENIRIPTPHMRIVQFFPLPPSFDSISINKSNRTSVSNFSVINNIKEMIPSNSPSQNTSYYISYMSKLFNGSNNPYSTLDDVKDTPRKINRK